MIVKNILVYLEPKNTVDEISRFTINLAVINNARLFALSIIKRPDPNIKTRTDEQAWKRLYEIEEDAFEAGVKISLLLEELDEPNRTNISQKIIAIVNAFSIDMLIIFNNAKTYMNNLTCGLNIPVIVYPHSPRIRESEAGQKKITTNDTN